MADIKKAIEDFRGNGKAKSASELRAEIAALEKALREAEESELRAARRGDAERAVALLSAMKAAKSSLDKIWPDLFTGDKWETFNTPTAWPRSTSMKKAADLSETEVAAASERGAKAIAGL